MSGKSGGYHRVSGLRSPVVAGGGGGTTSSFELVVPIGSDVSATLTHNLGVVGSDYIVQIINSDNENIVLPFSRDENEVIFHFGDVIVEETFKVIIVH